MVAHRRYPLVTLQLARLARDARAEGLDFESFWQRAVRPDLRPILTTTRPRPTACVIWPSDSVESRTWRDVLAMPEVIEAWRRAYDQLPPTPGERALIRLAPLLSELQ